MSQRGRQGRRVPWEQSLGWENSQNGSKDKRKGQVSGLAVMRGLKKQIGHLCSSRLHLGCISIVFESV